jgi:hypothetical protein
MIVDSRTLQSTPESRARVHAAGDMPGHLLALPETAASEQDRAQVKRLAEELQQIKDS